MVKTSRTMVPNNCLNASLSTITVHTVLEDVLTGANLPGESNVPDFQQADHQMVLSNN